VVCADDRQCNAARVAPLRGRAGMSPDRMRGGLRPLPRVSHERPSLAAAMRGGEAGGAAVT
jgi:hypothetical protein